MSKTTTEEAKLRFDVLGDLSNRLYNLLNRDTPTEDLRWLNTLLRAREEEAATMVDAAVMIAITPTESEPKPDDDDQEKTADHSERLEAYVFLLRGTKRLLEDFAEDPESDPKRVKIATGFIEPVLEVLEEDLGSEPSEIDPHGRGCGRARYTCSSLWRSTRF